MSGTSLTGDQVRWLYQELLGRSAAPDEVEHQLANADGLEALLVGMFSSDEWQRRHAAIERGLQGVASDGFIANLRLLNDTLTAAGFGDRYWLWGGLLIGWAREGLPLAHDTHDADFCIRREDLPEFGDAARALMDAGFRPLRRFLANDGRVAELSFERDGARFEFFVLTPVAAGELEYHDLDDGFRGGPPTQATARIAAQPLVPFEFLARRWLKHRDHAAELQAMYGDWRSPDPDWHHMRDAAIVNREPWRYAAALSWDGDLSMLDAPRLPA